MHWTAIVFATCCIFCSCSAQGIFLNTSQRKFNVFEFIVCFLSLLLIKATLFGNGSNDTIEQSYLVVLDGDATAEEGMLFIVVVLVCRINSNRYTIDLAASSVVSKKQLILTCW